MSINLRWETIQQQQVLVYEFKSGWKWQDFDTVKEEADALLEASDEAVPLIFDITNGNEMLPFMLQNTRNMARTRHPNGTPVIIVGANHLIQTTYKVVKQLLGKHSSQLTEDVIFVATWQDIEVHILTNKKSNQTNL